MAKDPAFLFYPQDFLTGVMFMSDEEVGKYIKLLCAQHQQGGIIIKTCFNSMAKDSEALRSKFVETDDGFFNIRLMSEMEKRKKKSCNLSANALKRWEKEKQLQCKSNAIALQLDMQTENENENEIITDNKDEKEDKKAEVSKRNPPFKPPTLQEFSDYCDEHGYRGIADRAYRGYDAAGWKDSQGKQIKSWKQKLQHVWFREDNKAKEQTYTPPHMVGRVV